MTASSTAQVMTLQLDPDFDGAVRDPHKHGLSSNNMALISSDYGVMRSLSIKWPYSPRVVRPSLVVADL